MARRHWRFVVRDQYGFVIQNAQVFVYLPGTTTVFTGTAYNAASGGSPVTNPFTTNAFGEVEAWFDTAQVVDVKVTDNSDTAYRAVGGPSATVSFSDFTESDDIYVSASDQVSQDFGEAGDIAAGIVNPFTAVTAVAGATGEYADAAHVHPYTALTPGAPEKPRSVAGAGDDLEPARDDHIHGFMAALGKTSKFTTASNTSEQSIHSLSVPLNTLAAGSMFKITMYGYQTNSTTAITYTFRVRIGDTTLTGTVIGQALALVGTTTAHTDNPVQLQALLTIQSIGATGTATLSWFGSECITTAVANTPKLVLDVQNAAATIDTTETALVELTVQMSATTGTPNLEVDNVLIEQVA